MVFWSVPWGKSSITFARPAWVHAVWAGFFCSWVGAAEAAPIICLREPSGRSHETSWSYPTDDSFLDLRQVQLDEHIKNYSKGIPLGSSLGPILWNLCINDLLETNFGPHTKVQAFADDILIMLTAPASYHFTNSSKNAINIIHNWTRLNLMTVNHQKSFFTILSSKK
ncbi:hypothetical protein CDAR_596031 [Caerostris darwini]|uniref:Reverse transcriptase domain-containing protein n=1 Tax=Caerostris darwini TaxID=1538125 RepID=A0AAV4TEI5_9ARAC|nr:hypothetical protein CDAR_596031 [Caerostris darwini]